MAILFCAILIKVYVAKIKKYNQLLFEKQLEQQKAVSQSILETQEETFNNIALDLHDDAGQRLTYVNLQLEQLKLQEPELLNSILPISQSVNDLAINLRDLSYSLTSNSLEKRSLFQVIEKELGRINKLGVVEGSLLVEDQQAFYFTLEEKIIHYRIFQEITNNMLKHSRASNFTLTVSQPEQPIFIYKDNGKGFDVEQESASSGLSNLNKRCEHIDYKFEMESVINQGTSIRIFKS
jgi:signal transduction histidine kinase